MSVTLHCQCDITGSYLWLTTSGHTRICSDLMLMSIGYSSFVNLLFLLATGHGGFIGQYYLKGWLLFPDISNPHEGAPSPAGSAFDIPVLLFPTGSAFGSSGFLYSTIILFHVPLIALVLCVSHLLTVPANFREIFHIADGSPSCFEGRAWVVPETWQVLLH